MRHLTSAELEAGLAHILRSPADAGTVELIVRRPAVEQRDVVAVARLDPEEGLVGDNWRDRFDGVPDRDRQLTLVNSRLVDLVAQSRDRWPLAGDQLYVDLDLGVANLPTGTRLRIGEAIVEITPPPHTGCDKFSRRFGVDALRFVNVGPGRDLRLRGVYARVVEGGDVKVGDVVAKI